MVLAIAAVLVTGVVSMFLSVSTYRAKQAVKLIDSAMSETRVQALSKTSAWMELSAKSDGTYVIVTSYAGEELLNKSYTISYTIEGSAAEVPITAAAPLVLTYDRSTGGFSDLKTLEADGTLTGRGVYCDSITVSKGSKSFKIRLYRDTGKHKCED